MTVFKSHLLDYQKQGFDKLKDLPFGCLFLDPGLGKTITSIAIAQYWLKNGICDTVCIFTKKHLIKTWQDEFLIHTNLTPIIPKVKNNSFRYSFYPSDSVQLLHYNSTQTILNHILYLFRHFRVGLILDECQVIKNLDSAMTKRFSMFSSLAKRKLILTGTPIANRPFDILSQVRFLNPSRHFTSVLPEQGVLDIPRNGLIEDFDKLESSIRSLRSHIDEFSFFYTKEKLKLKSKRNIEYIGLDLNIQHRKIYINLAQNLQRVHGKRMLLKELGELIKACSNPFDDHLKQEFLTSKDVYLVKDIKSKMRNNKSCVIWCSFIHTSERLANLLKQYNPLCVNGTLNIEKRNRVIDAFKQTSPSILIATMQSCKEGLNLQNATYAYFYDLSLKLEDILQAQDRIHRLSQKEDVFIKFLFYKNTIESWILDLFKLKKHFSVDIFNNFLRLNPDKVFGTSHELSKYLVNEKAA